MRIILGLLVCLATLVAVCYTAVWWEVVEPILTVAEAIDNSTATASLVGWEVIKFLFKEIIAMCLLISGFTLGVGLISTTK